MDVAHTQKLLCHKPSVQFQASAPVDGAHAISIILNQQEQSTEE